jgi:ATP-dependent DNA helicase RecG
MIAPTTPIENVFRLNAHLKRALKKLGLVTLYDLLCHFPSRYQPSVEARRIKDLEVGKSATIYGSIKDVKIAKTFHSKTPVAQAVIDDGSGTIHVVWFHQPYIAKMLPEGGVVKVVGKVVRRGKILSMANPEIEAANSIDITLDGSLFKVRRDIALFPVYPESLGVTSRWLYHAIQKLFAAKILEKITDPIPPEILNRYHLPTLKTAFVWIHSPKKERDSLAARKRFAFEEVFYIQLSKQRERRLREQRPSFRIKADRQAVEEFIARFPFSPTKAQKKAIEVILKDFEAPHAMSRLLEGDVGSGKTAVAAATAYAVVTERPVNISKNRRQEFGSLQVAYMAPTEILAKQHFASFIEYFRHIPVNIGLITSSGCKKFPSKVGPGTATNISRTQLLKWVASGEMPVLVGTHALIQKNVRFKDLAYVIIDEQHRFGTSQRQRLARKESRLPHLLSMTATPIPRTLALTIYGDLDLTLLDEMPAGRKTVITEIVPPQCRSLIYEKARRELQAGRQAYIICPRIDEPDPKKELALYAKSVKEEAKRLEKGVFQEFSVGILHSKMKPKEKEEVMADFAAKKIDILVATSVVEVGINVANATVIIIEGAERFGLAQLHQLRGRVLRSTRQSYCFVVAETKGAKTIARLRALETAKNGFELAELDLKLRGPGALSGKRQWGISDIGMEALKNIKMVEAAREEAQKMIASDPELKKYPLIKERVIRKNAELHFE